MPPSTSRALYSKKELDDHLGHHHPRTPHTIIELINDPRTGNDTRAAQPTTY